MTWYAWDRDWAGPIRIEVDRRWSDGWPSYPNLARSHPIRLHVRASRPPEAAPAEIERLTDVIVGAAGADALLVARTHRPDRTMWLLHLRDDRAQAARDAVLAVPASTFAPLVPIDVGLHEDPHWDLYLRDLVPGGERWSLGFPDRDAADRAAPGLGALGLEVGAPLAVGDGWAVAARGSAPFPAVEAVAVAHGGSIEAHDKG